jgi:hypothetical protein
MVIVITSPLQRATTRRRLERRAAGIGVDVARNVAAAGARVEIVGKVGDDEAGNAIAVELERAGVGHAALLRDPSSATPVEGREASLAVAQADVELALRYLADFRVVIAVDPLEPAADEVVREAARYAGAHRIVLAAAADGGGRDEDVTVLQAPARDHGAFAAFVGRYAALIDAGREPAEAFAAAAADVGWEPAGHR